MPLTFANKITLLRILALPFFIASVLNISSGDTISRKLALGIFIFAIITDMIDGYIARSRKEKTRSGAILDPLADKLLLASAFICLYVEGSHLSVERIPIWIVAVVVSRDVILIIGGMIIYGLHEKLVLESNAWGKAATFFQFITIISILTEVRLPQIILYAMLLLTVISAFEYIRKGIKTINMEKQ
ncbi:MAG: CDP-diacylglycerol--glycerol-3-phosphate 3-phosphatidyltransferase [Candidatus Omnitrophica bacterium]|nr:CDP-diacylglycerol--glycerol-3-phosphate 3-phosphatidyltransferase [Candidatus Omnitrophota bacterium]